jgi:hypothetical protein
VSEPLKEHFAKKLPYEFEKALMGYCDVRGCNKNIVLIDYQL